MTGFFARPEALPLAAGVVVLDTRPVAFLGVAFADSAGFFLTGSVRFGLFDAAKKSDVVVCSTTSGVGSRFCFFGAGFLGVAFLGLYTMSLAMKNEVHILTSRLHHPRHPRRP